MNEKTLIVSDFSNTESNNKMATDVVYGYYAGNGLKQKYGISKLYFSKHKDNGSLKEYNIDLSSYDITGAGLSSFYQYLSRADETVYHLVVYGADKKIYLHEIYDQACPPLWMHNLTFENPPISLQFKKDGEDAIIMSDGEKMICWKTYYSPYEIQNTPKITSMCMNENTLFCTIKHPAYKVWYTFNLDAAEVGSAYRDTGYISLEDDLGYSTKVVALKQDVFVFREYGISKITRLQNEFKVTQIYNANTKIINNSVSVCDGCIVFLTKDGFYVFNGSSVKKLNLNIKKYLGGKNDLVVSASLGKLYYCALNLNQTDDSSQEMKNNSLVVLDTDSGEYQIIKNVDVLALQPIKAGATEKMVMLDRRFPSVLAEVEEGYTVLNSTPFRYWSSKKFYGNSTGMVITDIQINGDCNAKITLHYDENTKILDASKSKNFKMHLSCKCFSLEVQDNSQTDSSIDNIAINYYEN